jgi:hypothetical protein
MANAVEETHTCLKIVKTMLISNEAAKKVCCHFVRGDTCRYNYAGPAAGASKVREEFGEQGISVYVAAPSERKTTPVVSRHTGKCG